MKSFFVIIVFEEMNFVVDLLKYLFLLILVFIELVDGGNVYLFKIGKLILYLIGIFFEKLGIIFNNLNFLCFGNLIVILLLLREKGCFRFDIGLFGFFNLFMIDKLFIILLGEKIVNLLFLINFFLFCLSFLK